MTRPDDLDGVSEHPLPDELVERLLTGASPGAGVDEPTVAVAQVLHAARQAPSTTELAEADAAAAAFVARMAGVMPTTVISLDAHRRRRAGRVSTRVAAGVAVLTLFSAGAAAAATGHLPDPVQRTVAQAVSHVGVDLPSPDDRRDEAADGDDGSTSTSAAGSSSSSSSATTAASTSSAASTSAATTPSSATTDDRGDGPDSSATEGSSVSTPVGPDVTGEARKGLCNAWGEAAQERRRAQRCGLRQPAQGGRRRRPERRRVLRRRRGAGHHRREHARQQPALDRDDRARLRARGQHVRAQAEGASGHVQGPRRAGPAHHRSHPPPQANGTLPSATSVKPGNGGGNK